MQAMTQFGLHGQVHGSGAHAGEETRARILEVALELIADHGFAATSTREIAERLGFTKAALYYHFRTKDELLAAIVSPVLDDVEALIDDAEHRSAKAGRTSARRQFVEGYVDLVASHADLIRVLYNDPSVKQCAGMQATVPLFQRMVPLLAGTDALGTAERTRARAAFGAVHSAILYVGQDDEPQVVRRTAVEAACGALGLPGAGRVDHR